MALLMVLSSKHQTGSLIILDELKLEKAKTKIMAEIFAKLPFKGSCLLVLPGMDKNVIRAGRNLADCQIMQAKDLNVLDLLQFKYLIMPKDSIKVIKETFAK